MSHYQRVSKQMVQMFGPQWTDKFGTKNEAWEEALKDLTFAQVQAGIRKVMQGALKFYEIDLPRFRELCKPPSTPLAPEAMKRPEWMEGMCEDEIQMHCYANMKMLVWCCRHPKYGLPPHAPGTESFNKKQNGELWKTARRISHDFFMMREELGKENVPQEDFLKALIRAWERTVQE